MIELIVILNAVVTGWILWNHKNDLKLWRK